MIIWTDRQQRRQWEADMEFAAALREVAARRERRQQNRRKALIAAATVWSLIAIAVAVWLLRGGL